MHAIRLWMWLFSMENDGFNDDTLSIILCRRASLYIILYTFTFQQPCSASVVGFSVIRL